MHEPEHWGYVYFATENKKDTPVTLPEEAPLLQWMYTQFSKNLALAKQKKTVPNQVQAQWRGQNITFTKETIQDTVYWRSKNPFTATSYKIRYDGKLSVEN